WRALRCWMLAKLSAIREAGNEWRRRSCIGYPTRRRPIARLISIFRIGDEQKVGEFDVDDKEAAKFVGIFERCLEGFFILDEFALNELVDIGSIILPLCLARFRIDQQLSDGLINFANRKNRICREAPSANLIGCLFEGVSYFDEIT